MDTYDDILSQLEKDCRLQIADASPLNDDDSSYCGKVWDGLICWNETKAGITAETKCPEFTASTDDSALARRLCDENGNWKFYETFNKTWTDYSQCMDERSEPEPPERQLQILYSVGYSLSVIALVIAITIFLYFRKLRCPRNTIHIHFFVSFILRAIFIFIRDIMQAHVAAMSYQHVASSPGNTYQHQTPLCRMTFTLIQYFLVANYYWLLVEGVYLHSLITLAVFSGRTNLRYYFALGWGCPALIVLPWAIRNLVEHESGCWWENVVTNPSYWIIKAPVMLSILVNFILFLNITRVLATKLRASNAAEARVYSKLAKSTLVLIPIFGVYYIVTVGMHASTNHTVTLVRMYVDLIISPFQGLILATLYCFLNGDVQSEINRKWKLHKINRTLSSTNRSVVPRSTAHSRSSVSTPPRKDSVEGGLENERGESSHRFSVIGRIIALKSRLFQKKKPRGKGKMNGSVGNHKDATNGRPLPGTCKTETEVIGEGGLSATEDDTPTETTRLKEEGLNSNNENGTKVDENKDSRSDEDKLLEDEDSANHDKDEEESSRQQHTSGGGHGGTTEPKKGVHFAATIETEV